MMRSTIVLAALFAATAFAQQPTPADGKKAAGQQASPAMQEEDPLAPYASKRHIQEWRAKNVWFGSDSSKTEFAVEYAAQLRKEKPNLTGRPFLNAVSAKVKEAFGSGK